MEKVNQSGIIGKIGDCLIHDLVHRKIEKELLKELESWNEKDWQQYKRKNYEVISLNFKLTDD